MRDLCEAQGMPDGGLFWQLGAAPPILATDYTSDPTTEEVTYLIRVQVAYDTSDYSKIAELFKANPVFPLTLLFPDGSRQEYIDQEFLRFVPDVITSGTQPRATVEIGKRRTGNTVKVHRPKVGAG